MWWVVAAFAGEPPCEPLKGTRFAEAVVSFAVGPGVEPAYANPTEALGAPNFHEGAGAVSLGNRQKGAAELIVAFGAAWLTDGPGPDLVVFEQGPSAEPTELAVSLDGATWVTVGTIGGAVREVDLQGKVAPGARFSMVRLRTANEQNTAAPWAGPDIDAVGLTNACAAARNNS
jgi:hypothetical protein